MSRPLLLLAFIAGALAFNPYPKGRIIDFQDNAGPKMVFSKYIKEGRQAEARSQSLVTGLKPNVTSYAGFFTVDDKYPLAIWLQGGPGVTSIFGLLTELGPYNLNSKGSLELRQYSWNRNASYIFIDNPVGTGFSYTSKLSCYATEQTQVGRDVVNALEQFFEIFPEYKTNDFYVTGESFGGHYVPSVAYTIHKSIAIGNGWTDPENQLVYSDYVYQLGLVDSATRDEIAGHEQTIRDYIAQGKYFEATIEENYLLSLFKDRSGFTYLYNYLYANGEPEVDIDGFVAQRNVREALHVGNATWHNDFDPVYHKLFADITRSVRPWLEKLLENYKVLIYNGQLDIVVAYPLTEEYLKKLEWSGAANYRNATRKLWRVGNALAGYAKSSGDFTEVMVRNAGHMVPTDQPEWALDLINRFFNNQPIGD